MTRLKQLLIAFVASWRLLASRRSKPALNFWRSARRRQCSETSFAFSAAISVLVHVRSLTDSTATREDTLAQDVSEVVWSTPWRAIRDGRASTRLSPLTQTREAIFFVLSVASQEVVNHSAMQLELGRLKVCA